MIIILKIGRCCNQIVLMQHYCWNNILMTENHLNIYFNLVNLFELWTRAEMQILPERRQLRIARGLLIVVCGSARYLIACVEAIDGLLVVSLCSVHIPLCSDLDDLNKTTADRRFATQYTSC